MNKMKREIKNILFISDNYNRETFYSASEDFKLFLAETFREIPKVDIHAVFIDYGFIDNCYDKLEYNLGVIDKFYRKGIPLVWCGGLPTRYNNDAKIVFPDIKYLHDLPSCEIRQSDVFFMLTKLFSNTNKSKEQNK